MLKTSQLRVKWLPEGAFVWPQVAEGVMYFTVSVALALSPLSESW